MEKSKLHYLVVASFFGKMSKCYQMLQHATECYGMQHVVALCRLLELHVGMQSGQGHT